MSVGLAWKSAAKSNEKLVNQKYATLFLSWMLLKYRTRAIITRGLYTFYHIFEGQKRLFKELFS